MHLYTLLLISAFFSCINIIDAIETRIFSWPLRAPQPSILARIAYDPSTLETNVIDYTPPSPPSDDINDNNDDLVRVGLFVPGPTNSTRWVGSLTSWSSFSSAGRVPTFSLHLGSSNEVYHVSLSSSSQSNGSSTLSSPVKVDLIPLDIGPRPHLNKPIILSPDGKSPEELPEKSFLQKYWWVFLIVMFLAMSGGGEGQS